MNKKPLPRAFRHTYYYPFRIALFVFDRSIQIYEHIRRDPATGGTRSRRIRHERLSNRCATFLNSYRHTYRIVIVSVNLIISRLKATADKAEEKRKNLTCTRRRPRMTSGLRLNVF